MKEAAKSTARLTVCRIEYEIRGKMKDQPAGIRDEIAAADPWIEAKRIVELAEGQPVKVRGVAISGSVIVERIPVLHIPGVS